MCCRPRPQKLAPGHPSFAACLGPPTPPAPPSPRSRSSITTPSYSSEDPYEEDFEDDHTDHHSRAASRAHSRKSLALGAYWKTFRFPRQGSLRD